MASIAMQRDLVLELKKETFLNLEILSKINPMPGELSKLVYDEIALVKPTQNVFNHLVRYLVSIIDPNVISTMPWPLYDSKTERAYRNQVFTFITDYSNRGLLSPVMSSYLVNPGCYKVTRLLYQMSQLAVQKLVTAKITNDITPAYAKITEKCKSDDEGLLEEIEKETKNIKNSLSLLIHGRKIKENAAALLRQKIIQMETKLKEIKGQEYISNLVDNFLKKHPVDDETKTEIMSVKNVSKSSPFLDSYLIEVDRKLDDLNSNWDEKFTPSFNIGKRLQSNIVQLRTRQDTCVDKSNYMIEYNHKTDRIDTSNLEQQVNSEQNYILKNLVKDGILNFPNLIRAYLVAISFTLKNIDIVEIHKADELKVGRERYSELAKAMRGLVEGVYKAEANLKSSPRLLHHSSLLEIPSLPPIPDLSDLHSMKELQCEGIFDSFTPFSMSKHQFNLYRKSNISFAKPFSRSITQSFNYRPKDDFVKSIISSRANSFDRQNISHNIHNLSVISQSNKNNETISECRFTKQQISRLLSTKKLSSTKKNKFKSDHSHIKIRKGSLFNESSISIESSSLIRCHSSPNLSEKKEPSQFYKTGRRKLSIMQEDVHSLLEVSGITAIETERSYDTPKFSGSFKTVDAKSTPVISITQEQIQFNQVTDSNEQLNQKITSGSQEPSPIVEVKTDTPKNLVNIKKQTSSLEKIINRFKKVRESVLNETRLEAHEFKMIVEEKENMNVNRVLLPDLLSPSCSVVINTETDYLDKICVDMEERVSKMPRQSLGTALGVDDKFLDQFDLVD